MELCASGPTLTFLVLHRSDHDVTLSSNVIPLLDSQQSQQSQKKQNISDDVTSHRSNVCLSPFDIRFSSSNHDTSSDATTNEKTTSTFTSLVPIATRTFYDGDIDSGLQDSVSKLCSRRLTSPETGSGKLPVEEEKNRKLVASVLEIVGKYSDKGKKK